MISRVNTTMPLLKELLAIVECLNGTNAGEIALGILSLEQLLLGLVSSVRKLHTTGVQDTKLAAFVTLQDNFQYNLTDALISAYHTLQHETLNTSTLYLANRLLQGILLIHPDSRALFGRRKNMELMLSFLDPENPAYLVEMCISFVSLFIHMLLKSRRNMRVFEACGGCLRVIRHLHISLDPRDASRNLLQQNLHFKVIEFLIFYLTEEKDLQDQASVPTLTVAQKADLFRPEFPEIEDLIENLNDLTRL